jgi:hypothetical protein
MLANVTTSLLYMLEYSFLVHRCILVKNGKLREKKMLVAPPGGLPVMV